MMILKGLHERCGSCGSWQSQALMVVPLGFMVNTTLANAAQWIGGLTLQGVLLR